MDRILGRFSPPFVSPRRQADSRRGHFSLLGVKKGIFFGDPGTPEAAGSGVSSDPTTAPRENLTGRQQGCQKIEEGFLQKVVNIA